MNQRKQIEYFTSESNTNWLLSCHGGYQSYKSSKVDSDMASLTSVQVGSRKYTPSKPMLNTTVHYYNRTAVRQPMEYKTVCVCITVFCKDATQWPSHDRANFSSLRLRPKLQLVPASPCCTRSACRPLAGLRWPHPSSRSAPPMPPGAGFWCRQRA